MARMTKEQAQAILARDPLRYFTPTPTQEQFLRRPVDSLYSLIDAPNRGGKSTISCVDLAYTLRGIHPYRPNYTGLTIIQFTPSRLQAANVVGAKLFKKSELMLPNAPDGVGNEPMIPAWEIEKLNEPNVAGMKVPYECIMKNGNRLLFSWSGVDGIAKRIAGLKIDGAYIDENSGTQALFDELYPRLLDAQSDTSRPGLGYFVWATTNVEYNEAYESFHERFERAVSGHKVYSIGKNENPAINIDRREALKEVLSENARRIRMDGDMSAGDLVSIFGKQWHDQRHIHEKPYEIQPDDNLWVGYDPGVDHPMGMIVVAINKTMQQRLNVVKAWNYRGETIEKDANVLAEYLGGRKIAGFVYDTNLKNRDRGGGPSVLQRFKELLGARGISPLGGYYQSKKNHAPGIAIMRHYLDPNPDDRGVPPLLMIDPPTPENGLGVFRSQILKYRGREGTKFTGPGGVIKRDDDLMDPTRYICILRPSYNPQWACGMSTNTTSRVAILDANDNLIPTNAMSKKPEPPRFDFHNRVFLARSRDRAARNGWKVVNI